MRRFVTLFHEYKNIHLTKDVGQIPSLMHRDYGYEASVVTYANEPEYSPKAHQASGVAVNTLPNLGAFRQLEIALLFFLWKNARHIDVLHLFQLGTPSVFYAALYKHLHPRGFVYIKMDLSASAMQNPDNIFLYTGAEHSSRRYKRWKERYLLRLMDRSVDLVSAESHEDLEKMRRKHPGMADRFIYIPNGLDERRVMDQFGPARPFDEKENIVLTVGRIGTAQKNTELLLSATDVIAKAGWSLYLVGPATADFESTLSAFLARHPEFKTHVRHIGPQYDPKELFNWFDRAKIFCLTSRWEGSPMVFPEAMRFGNYIVSTDFASAKDATDDGRLGALVPQEDVGALRRALSEAIASADRLRYVYEKARERFFAQFSWSHAIQTLEGRIQHANQSH